MSAFTPAPVWLYGPSKWKREFFEVFSTKNEGATEWLDKSFTRPPGSLHRWNSRTCSKRLCWVKRWTDLSDFYLYQCFVVRFFSLFCFWQKLNIISELVSRSSDWTSIQVLIYLFFMATRRGYFKDYVAQILQIRLWVSLFVFFESTVFGRNIFLNR